MRSARAIRDGDASAVSLTTLAPRGFFRPVKRQSSFAVAFVLASAMGFADHALAAGGPRASDRAFVEDTLRELDALPESERAAAEPSIEKAKSALDRATSAQGGGDRRAGELLEGVAREWIEAAKEAHRAALAEAEANARQAEAADVKLRAERARALLEEAISRRGRAEAELRRLAEEAKSAESKPPSTKPAKGRAKR